MSTHENAESRQDPAVAAAIVEEIREEIAELEEYAKRGEAPPRCRGYLIRVNGQRHVINEPKPTRETILTTAGFTPTANFTLYIKKRGEKLDLIEPNERVDLREVGVEKFKVLPRDQTEG